MWKWGKCTVDYESVLGKLKKQNANLECKVQHWLHLESFCLSVV